jgi:beta-glucosidase
MSDFLWGVATSAYQIEGAADNDWSAWEREGRLRARHERCGTAAGHAELWESDFDLLPTLSVNAYRFSVEWSRIEPEPGRFSQEALESCRQRIRRLRLLGVEPVLTLFHYTHPLWFWKFGWEDPRGRDAFVRFAAVLADAVGDLISTYTILNEPLVFILGGYLDAAIPPGRKNLEAAGRALENILRAHNEVVALFRERNPHARFGIAHNMMDFAPERNGSVGDRALAEAADRFYNRSLLEGMGTGRVDLKIPTVGRVRFAIEDFPASCDFVGVNYYSRLHLRLPGRSRLLGEFAYRDPAGRGLTDTGWEVHPSGLGRCLRLAAETGRPVLVTENGIATRDDGRRRDFLREHAVVLSHARRSGIDVKGYFYWSLLDNFEWLEGFSPRFGLYEVDYATFARRRRPSADLFAELGRSFLHTGLSSI